MTTSKEPAFKVVKVTPFSQLEAGHTIPKSDLALQEGGNLYQFEFENDEEKKTLTIIKPGTWTFVESSAGIKLEPVKLSRRRLLLEASNTHAITEEANHFFSHLDIYRQLERPIKRGVLLYSEPGLGKTAGISWFCNNAVEQDPGTVVLVWPTSKIDASDIETFLATDSKYAPEATRVILVIEDIGGSDQDGGGHRRTSSSLLNLLDGATVTFSLPTFIIATTNAPQNLLSSLADRPGRFDLLMEMKPPNAEERVKLMEFIAKRALTEDERVAVSDKEAEGLSVAHLDEIVVRSLLHSKTIQQSLKEILDHRKLVSKSFDKNERTMGLGGIDDFD